MNLSDIRQRVFEQADWAPTQSSAAVARMNRFINRAVDQLAEEAPFLFFQEELPVVLQPDFYPASSRASSDTLSVYNGDRWVLRRSISFPSSSTLDTPWAVDRTWDGRLVQIVDPTNSQNFIRKRIRSVYNFGAGPTYSQLITLYEPWDNTTDTGLQYRIFTDRYYTPADMIMLESFRMLKTTFNAPFELLTQDESEYLNLDDSPDVVASGMPRFSFRRSFYQLEGPKKAPTVERLAMGDHWTGPEPAGKFDYVITSVWGKRPSPVVNPGPGDYGAVVNEAGRGEPLWESAPSPVSSTITTTNNTNVIRVNLPNMDFLQGFGVGVDDSSTAIPRWHHSGWYTRIYRRRYTADMTNYNLNSRTESTLTSLDVLDDYVLLAEVPAYQTSYTDNGSVSPDAFRRLKSYHGYQSWVFYPRPDTSYTLTCRCIRRPPPLADDSDVPRVNPDGTDCLVWLAYSMLCKQEGRLDAAHDAQESYERHLGTLKKRYGSDVLDQFGQRRIPARAVPSRGRVRRWWQKYNA